MSKPQPQLFLPRLNFTPTSRGNEMLATIAALRTEARASKYPEERIDTFINAATYAECVEILDSLADVDLSEPAPDLRAGWSVVCKQLAYNALYAYITGE